MSKRQEALVKVAMAILGRACDALESGDKELAKEYLAISDEVLRTTRETSC